MVAEAGDAVVGLRDLVVESASVEEMVASAASIVNTDLVLLATFELRTVVRDAPAVVDEERVGKGPLKRFPVCPSGKR